MAVREGQASGSPGLGAEAVQPYLSDLEVQVVRPIQQLVAFRKVWLEPPQSARPRFGLHTDLMSFTGLDLTRVVEPGEMVLGVGTSSTDLPLSADFTLTGALRRVGEGRVLLPTVVVED